MAIVKGVNERVHLPLYDSLFVRPDKQLRDHVSSNVLKFFVNIQGKTKLETNMQISSLLPHWNTFEARALRVVISDLPEACLERAAAVAIEAKGNGHRRDSGYCFDDINLLLDDFAVEIDADKVKAVRETWSALRYTSNAITEDYKACLGILNSLCKTGHLENILKTQIELKAIRGDLSKVLAESSITRRAAVRKLRAILDCTDDDEEAKRLLDVLGEASECLTNFVKLNDLALRIKDEQLAGVETCIDLAERLATLTPLKNDRARLKERLRDINAERVQLKAELSNGCRQILGKLIYNSVTTLFVGEKIMIQMPTWFFPAGAGPYSDNGSVVTHGFPNPLATFHFAEPVTIDAKEHFRIEIEFPDADVVDQLHRLDGPFFIWVVLDGYLTRDVQ